MSEKHQRSGQVFARGMSFARPSACSRNGCVERKGKWWCKTHDPEAVSARRSARDAKWEAGFAQGRKENRLRAAAPAMLAALEEIIARNEIQHWFNLDQARAAVSLAKDEKP